MLLSRSKGGADVFFVSHLTASASVILLWIGTAIALPDFAAGLAAGMILASTVLMFANRAKDEYTLATWHAGTSAGFAVIVAFLVADALARGFNPTGVLGLRTAALTAVSAYLIAVLVKRWKERG